MIIYDTFILRGNEIDLVINVVIFYYILIFNASCGRFGLRFDIAEMEDVIIFVIVLYGVLFANRVIVYYVFVRIRC